MTKSDFQRSLILAISHEKNGVRVHWLFKKKSHVFDAAGLALVSSLLLQKPQSSAVPS